MILEVPPTALACAQGDEGLPDLETAVFIHTQYTRNGWRPSVHRDYIVNEVIFVKACIALGMPTVEVWQVDFGSTNDTQA